MLRFAGVMFISCVVSGVSLKIQSNNLNQQTPEIPVLDCHSRWKRELRLFDLREQFLGVVVVERKLTEQHRVQHNTQRPHV